MPRINKSKDNIVEIPMSVSVNKKGYVYLNTSSVWIEKKNGNGKTGSHDKVCIGFALNPGLDWAQDRRMYANLTYYKMKEEEGSTEDSSNIDNRDNEIPPSETTEDSVEEPIKLEASVYDEYPERSDSIAVGFHAAISRIAEESKLLDILVSVFGEENSALILDLASYMISERSAVFQHYPHWARSQALFSEKIRSDSYISRFEKNGVTMSQINLFKKKWIVNVLKDGKIYLCYDSTNVNSQAEGVFIVQKGHAKDDPSTDQVNIEYVLRQGDGLPVTYTTYPGSINDIAEAAEIIAFFHEILKCFNSKEKSVGSESSETGNSVVNSNEETQSETAEDNSTSEGKIKPDITMIADRGYISEENITGMRDSGLGFLMMLKKNMDIHDRILDKHIANVKKPINYLPAYHSFSLTIKEKLFKGDKNDTYFHIIWDSDLEVSHRSSLHTEVGSFEKTLKNNVRRKIRVTEKEIEKWESFFDINYHKDGKLLVNQRGKGAGKTTEVDAYVIDSYARNDARIELEDKRCGYMIYVSNTIETGIEAIQAMSKRDVVEKMFMTLKSMLGMDKLGVQFDSSMQTKSLIWFVAAILHALMFSKTEKLRVKERKCFTIPSIVNLLEEITGDKDLESGKYTRRYKPTSKQNKVLPCFGLNLESIEQEISNL